MALSRADSLNENSAYQVATNFHPDAIKDGINISRDDFGRQLHMPVPGDTQNSQIGVQGAGNECI